MASIQAISRDTACTTPRLMHRWRGDIPRIFLILLLCTIVALPVAAAPGWKFHADNQNTGVYDDGGKTPEGGLLWTFNTGGSIRSAPALDNGIVYVPSEDGNLYAVNGSDGTRVWTAPTGYAGLSSPAVADGVVFVGSFYNGLYAFNAGTGALLWNSPTGAAIYSSPAVEGGVVYFGCNNGRLYALDASSGTLLWEFNTSGGWISSSPAVADGIVYFGSDDHNLYALNTSTGEVVWKYTTGNEVESGPSVADGVVYFGSRDNNLYALNASTGSRIWNLTMSKRFDSTPAIAHGVLYVGCYDNNVYALNASTGAVIWNCTTGEPVYSSPAFANGVVYVGSLDNRFYALDASTGGLLWSSTTGGMIFSSPAVADGMVYVGSDDGGLYAYGSYPEIPPDSVTNLHAVSTQQLRITWNWTDPSPIGFSHVMVYLDGVFQENVTRGVQTYTATGLAPSTTHTIGTRTVGMKGMINETLVNQTATTSGLSISNLTPAEVTAGDPAFTLDVYGTGFTPDCSIVWNGEYEPTQYIDPGHLAMAVPPEKIAYPRYIKVSVYDSTSGESSNFLYLTVTDNPSGAIAWKFKSDIYNSGIYDNGGQSPEGLLLWNYTTGDAVSSSPVMADGILYVGSHDKNFYALDAITGRPLWNFTDRDNNWMTSAPAVANGIVYFGGYRTKVYALDAKTGALIWNYTRPSRYMTRISVSSSPAVANGIVYIGNFDGTLYALNAMNGALIWSYPTMTDYGDTGIYSSPAVADGIVYFGDINQHLYALNAETGDLIWKYKTGSQVHSSPAVAGGVVYFGSNDKNLYALDAKTGGLLWNYTTGAGVSSSPSVANGIVYFGSYDNSTYALDAGTGALQWKYTTGSRIGSSPAVANGVVYIGSNDNHLYALDAETGVFLWKFATGASISSSPGVADGKVYFGSNDKNVYVLGSPPIDGGGKSYYLVHSNVEGADVYLNGYWFAGTITNGTLLIQTCPTCTPIMTYTVKKCGYFALTQNNTQYAGNNQTVNLYANLTAPKEPLIADFTGNITSGPAPLTVAFTSHSIGIAESWNWSFGDGTYSEEENPVHTYTTNGMFTVSLSESNSACQNNTAEKPGYITVGTKPPVYADFTVSPRSGTAPLTVKCTDQSTGSPTMYSYNFGDGSGINSKNPTHTYRYPGVYNITLTITKFDRKSGSLLNSTTVKENAVTVSAVPVVPLVAGFSGSPVNGTAPLAVTFSDHSTGEPTLYSYDFGDGLNTTVRNPVHTYRYPGNYTVTLTVLKFDASSGMLLTNATTLAGYIEVSGE